jgi:hypothetical protein
MEGNEKFWIGPNNPELHLVYRMSSPTTEKKWFATLDGTELDPDYSEFSVRLHDPHICSLSFINQTMAILPKSRLRSIHKLIGEYLDEIDSDDSD